MFIQFYIYDKKNLQKKIINKKYKNGFIKKFKCQLRHDLRHS